MKINNKRWQLYEIEEYLADVEKRNGSAVFENTKPSSSVKQTSRRKNHS